MTPKLPQPQVQLPGVPGSQGVFPSRIKAYGKMWDYEYSTGDYPTAKRMKTNLVKSRDGRGMIKVRAIIKIFYEGKVRWYVVYARWMK